MTKLKSNSDFFPGILAGAATAVSLHLFIIELFPKTLTLNRRLMQCLEVAGNILLVVQFPIPTQQAPNLPLSPSHSFFRRIFTECLVLAIPLQQGLPTCFQFLTFQLGFISHFFLF